jgi:hypothetical protein
MPEDFFGSISLVCALVFLLAIPFAATAQQYSGPITGRSRILPAAVVGAEVMLTNASLGVALTPTAREQGVYSFSQLRVGTSEIHVKRASLKEFIAKSVEIHVSSTTEFNAKLELGASSDLVVVEASAVQAQTASAETGEIVQGTQVRQLLLARP